MKKVLGLIALLAILATLAAVPALVHAKTTDCVQPTAKPTPRNGPLGPPVDNPDSPGKIWVGDSDAGVTGPHGFMRVDTTRPRVYGYQTDSGVNGDFDATAAHTVCLSVLDNKITVP